MNKKALISIFLLFALVAPIKANEEIILQNFRSGEHPNTGVNQGPIWKQGMIGTAPDTLRRWKNSGAIKEIFIEEFRKLL